jgi:hypothetical protein
MTPTVLVVGFAATRPLTPRGERVRAIVQELKKDCRVELISGPTPSEPMRPRRSRTRRVAGDLARTIVLDRDEVASARWFAGATLAADAALLVGSPFSPMIWAARRLVKTHVPYVVDIGDPWALTNAKPAFPTVAQARAVHAERFLWEHARGGIVTTSLQATDLQAVFPSMPLVVQPNGFSAVPTASSRANGSHDPRCLRIVHYGDLYEPRLDVAPFLESLVRSRAWSRVSFTLHGVDWNRALDRIRGPVEVRTLAPMPWYEVVAAAVQHDLALVVGNRNPAQLPSKAVQYLTLPIPRVALINGREQDALANYIAAKPGWLAIRHDAPRGEWIDSLVAHATRHWLPADLEPPSSEAWPAACARIVEFFLTSTGLR